jgi:hypothetical protein
VRAFVLLAGLLAAGQAAPPPATPPSSAGPSTKGGATAAARKPAARKAPTPKPTPSPVLEGTVKSPEGKPIEGARVLYRSVTTRWGEPSSELKTDAEGRFRKALASGSLLYVRVEAKGYAPQSLEKLKPGAPLVVTLGRGRAIEGTVRDGEGHPVGGVRVIAADSDPLVAASPWNVEGRRSGLSDGRGRYRVEGLAPGLHSVTASGRGFGKAQRNGVRPGATVDLILPHGGGIAGLVTDASGRPLAGAVVRAEREDRRRRASEAEATDGEGRFELSGLRPGSYSVIARHSEHAPATASGVVVESEGYTEATLSLAAGATLVGRLLGTEDRPAAAGRVEILSMAGQPAAALQEVLRAEAGPDGSFRIERVPAGSLGFEATARGLAPRRIETDVSPKDTLVDLGDVVLEAGLSIRGRVRTTAGQPVAEARVGSFARQSFGVRRAFETRSEADGTFVLAGLEAGVHSLWAEAPGFARPEHKPVATGAENVELILTPGGSITGIVVDERGRPCDAYSVTAHPSNADGFWDTGGEKTVADPDGRFLLEELAAETYVLQVSAPDFAPGVASGIKVVASAMSDAGVIRLTHGGIVRGTVVDTGGLPVSGATVSLAGDPALERASWNGGFEATTDPGGGFEIRGVPTGARTVSAAHPDYAESSTRVDVDPARGPNETRLVLPRGGRIEGVVRGREGVPSAGLLVRWSSLGATPRQRSNPETRTGPDGSFVLDHVDPGTTQVQFFTSSRGGRFMSGLRRMVEVREGETTSLEVVLREVLVTGRVTRRGAPLAGGTVRFSGASGMSIYGGPFGPSEAPGPQRNFATCGDDGGFELILDEPGTYRVMVDVPASSSRLPWPEVAIPDVERHVIDFAFGGATVMGVVLDAEKEQPIGGAYVSGRPREGKQPTGTTQTADDGRFELDAEPGDYVWTASADGYAMGQVSSSVSTAGGPDLVFALKRGFEITGRLLDAAGRPMSGLEVASRPSDDGPDRVWANSFGAVLPDGTFRLQGLGPGNYNLCAGIATVGFAFRAGVAAGTRDVTLSVRPPGQVRIHATLPDGSPATEGWVEVKRLGGALIDFPSYGMSRTDAAGVVQLNVPAGTLDIEVGNERHMGTVRVSVAEGGTASAEVRLTEPVENRK